MLVPFGIAGMAQMIEYNKLPELYQHLQPLSPKQDQVLLIEANFVCTDPALLMRIDLIILDGLCLKDNMIQALGCVDHVLLRDCYLKPQTLSLHTKTLVMSRVYGTDIQLDPKVYPNTLSLDLDVVTLPETMCFPGPQQLFLHHAKDLSHAWIIGCRDTLVLTGLDHAVLDKPIQDLMCRHLVLTLDQHADYIGGRLRVESVIKTFPVIKRVPHLESLSLNSMLLGYACDLKHLKHLYMRDSWWRGLSMCSLDEILPLLETFECEMDRSFFEPRTIPVEPESESDLEEDLDGLPMLPTGSMLMPNREFVQEIKLDVSFHQHLRVFKMDYNGECDITIANNPQLDTIHLSRRTRVHKIFNNPKVKQVTRFASRLDMFDLDQTKAAFTRLNDRHVLLDKFY
jgi:hypothetical protein